MTRQISTLVLVAGLILLTGIYFYTAAAAAEPSAKPAVSAEPSAKPAAEPSVKAKGPVEPSAKPASAPPEPSAKPAGVKEPSVKMVPGAKGVAKVELQNDVPVRALQFAVTEAKISEVRTTDRTKGFLAKFNEKNGKVIILSTAGDEIAPGKGAIAEIVCDKPASAKLVDGKIVWNK
jgi:hypothetical protein